MSISATASLNCFQSLNQWGVFETYGFSRSVWRCFAPHFHTTTEKLHRQDQQLFLFFHINYNHLFI